MSSCPQTPRSSCQSACNLHVQAAASFYAVHEPGSYIDETAVCQREACLQLRHLSFALEHDKILSLKLAEDLSLPQIMHHKVVAVLLGQWVGLKLHHAGSLLKSCEFAHSGSIPWPYEKRITSAN